VVYEQNIIDIKYGNIVFEALRMVDSFPITYTTHVYIIDEVPIGKSKWDEHRISNVSSVLCDAFH